MALPTNERRNGDKEKDCDFGSHWDFNDPLNIKCIDFIGKIKTQ